MATTGHLSYVTLRHLRSARLQLSATQHLSLVYIQGLCVLLRATAGTAIARLISHRNSVRLSVRLSVTRVDQAKTVQARIIKSSPSAAPKTLVSGSVTHVFPKIS